MKPDWDELESTHKDSDLVTIADVDCTTDGGKPLCERLGVGGYPTIKYFLAGGEPAKGKDYNGGRDLAALKSFVTKTFKPACKPSSGEGCNEAQKALIEEYKEKDFATELETLETDLKAKKADRKTAENEFKKKRKEMKTEEKSVQKKIGVLKLLTKEAASKEEL
eukprot:GEMP01046989.1.p1 GENE.GEMP01046989.1~~GEMP01046989.1.p1  ORF type:complete len:165 (+),score=46.00 GEMP01046989.1:202-696(+)